MANAKRIFSNARTSDRSKDRGIVSWTNLQSANLTLELKLQTVRGYVGLSNGSSRLVSPFDLWRGLINANFIQFEANVSQSFIT